MTSAFFSGRDDFSEFDDNIFMSDWPLYTDTSNYDRLGKEHFKMIADKGFDHIRFQIRWDTHFIGKKTECLINPEYMKQVRWAVDNTISKRT
jgi:hypothetical protein